MRMNNAKLFDSLHKTREWLKRRYVNNGRTPTICTDDALRELTRLMPRNKTELEAVKGLGKVFYEKYGDYFLADINRFINAGKRTVPLRPEVRRTLKRLEDRLVNISRRNRLLYMGKISAKNAFDLYWDNHDTYNEQIVKFIHGEVKVLSVSHPSYNRDWRTTNERRHKNCTKLLREAAAASRESGEDDLFIAYPFVRGMTAAEDFTVRAPLLLIPVEVHSGIEAITLRLAKHRDIL